MDLSWYWHRARSMSAPELANHLAIPARQAVWTARRDTDRRPRRDLRRERAPLALLPSTSTVPDEAREAVIRSANEVLSGTWPLLGVPRADIASPAWFYDPITQRTAPSDPSAFRLNYRREADEVNLKQVWELSRHHHLTVLATAWWCTHDEGYANAVDTQLRSWWQSNPPMRGIHWTSGIELGTRIIAWSWIRRLLDDWQPVRELFDTNDIAIRSIYWHQRYLSAFYSRGSSANNHLVAEAVGLLVGSCNFPWFRSSHRWRSMGLSLFERALENNLFTSGLNREQASDYHGFVAELSLIGAVEHQAAGGTVSETTWRHVCRMVDAAYAMVDERHRPPRQGDGDDARALVVDGGHSSSFAAVLACGATVFESLPWWESVDSSVEAVLLGALLGERHEIAGRPSKRPDHFADAGFTLLRTDAAPGREIWCRCDGGPHGFPPISAHAHADALSIEVRQGGIDILADPGTYCYHGEPEWRNYFRSTIGHNTLEIDGADQSQSRGPFLWQPQASTALIAVVADHSDGRSRLSWSARHDGYQRATPPAWHVREVHLEIGDARLEVIDRVESAGRHRLRLAYHLGPEVQAELRDHHASLRWMSGTESFAATLRLPTRLQWTSHRGEPTPPLGWYSAAFGLKEPTTVLVGQGESRAGTETLCTALEFSQ